MFRKSLSSKTLVAAAVVTAVCGGAAAQSNVQIYGLVDTGYLRETATDARMGSSAESRIGFRGMEDLGGGLKATFELEKRFNLNDGTNSDSYTGRNNSVNNTYHADDAIHGHADGVDWKGAANLGLKGNWGAVRFGRVANIGTEYFNLIDPFGEYSVAASFTGSGGYLYSEHLSNYVRYDSPGWHGFSFGVGFVPRADKDSNTLISGTRPNHGWNVGLMYDYGPLLLLTTYTRMPDSHNSDAWNIGAGYSFGPVTVRAGYQNTLIKLSGDAASDTVFTYFGGASAKQQEAIVGLVWDVGPGHADFSYNYAKYKEGSYSGKAHKYAVGYTYSLSKRTDIYGMVAYTNADDAVIGSIYHSNHQPRDTVAAVQVGMQHRF